MKAVLYISMLLYCYSIIGTQGKKSESTDIAEVEFHTISWNVLIHARQTIESFLNLPEWHNVRVTTREKYYMTSLNQALKSIKTAPDSINVNVATVCLVYRVNGAIDTLGFGSFNHFRYNSKNYYLTWDLLKLIMKKIPHEQAEVIDWYLNNDPEIEEQLKSQ